MVVKACNDATGVAVNVDDMKTLEAGLSAMVDEMQRNFLSSPSQQWFNVCHNVHQLLSKQSINTDLGLILSLAADAFDLRHAYDDVCALGQTGSEILAKDFPTRNDVTRMQLLQQRLAMVNQKLEDMKKDIANAMLPELENLVAHCAAVNDVCDQQCMQKESILSDALTCLEKLAGGMPNKAMWKDGLPKDCRLGCNRGQGQCHYHAAGCSSFGHQDQCCQGGSFTNFKHKWLQIHLSNNITLKS